MPPFGRRKRLWKRYFHHSRRFKRHKKSRFNQGCTLADVPPGCQARIAGFSLTIPANRKEHLLAYGMLPGYLVKVIQQAPVTVVQIEHTDLALERALAHAVLVKDINCGE